MAQPNSGSCTPGSLFHKHLDLAKLTTPKSHSVERVYTFSTAANSIQKIPSTSTMPTADLRKGSLFSSFALSSRRTKSTCVTPVPRVKIQAIIKKRADQYFDESLAKSVDSLLESGYTVVINRKNQKIELKSEEQELREQIAELERDILPELNRYFNLKESLRSAKEQNKHFTQQVAFYEQEIEKTNHEILARKAEIESARLAYLNTITEIDNEINRIKADIIKNRELHKAQLEDTKEEIKKLKVEKGTYKEELQRLKEQYDKVKANQSDKRRKIENKSRMFLGLLKH
jgi:hypothetical protein